MLGRPLRCGRGSGLGALPAGEVGPAGGSRAHLLCDLESSRRPGRVRSDRRAASGDPACRCVGRRETRGCEASGGEEAREDRARRHGRSSTRSPAASLGRRSWRVSPARRSGTRSMPSRRPPPPTGSAASRTSRRGSGAILEAFDEFDVNFALEVHPTEIAFDIASALRAVAAVGGHRALRVQLRPVPPRLPGRRLRRLHCARSDRAFSTPT